MRSIRAFGSAGINLAYLAMGAVDCYFEFGFHIWDYAGPCLLVRYLHHINDDFSDLVEARKYINKISVY